MSDALLARTRRLERTLFFRSWIAVALTGALLALAFWPRTSISLHEGDRRAVLEPGHLVITDGPNRIELDARNGRLRVLMTGPGAEIRIDDDGQIQSMRLDLGGAVGRVSKSGDQVEIDVFDGTRARLQYQSVGGDARWYAGSSAGVVRSEQPLPPLE